MLRCALEVLLGLEVTLSPLLQLLRVTNYSPSRDAWNEARGAARVSVRVVALQNPVLPLLYITSGVHGMHISLSLQKVQAQRRETD